MAMLLMETGLKQTDLDWNKKTELEFKVMSQSFLYFLKAFYFLILYGFVEALIIKKSSLKLFVMLEPQHKSITINLYIKVPLILSIMNRKLLCGAQTRHLSSSLYKLFTHHITQVNVNIHPNIVAFLSVCVELASIELLFDSLKVW